MAAEDTLDRVSDRLVDCWVEPVQPTAVQPETRYARSSDHGGGACLRRLAAMGRLIVFDKRGSGASDPMPSGEPTWEDWADDIRSVMDAAGSERAAIVGVADSGPLAMLFAATYPELVSSLTP